MILKIPATENRQVRVFALNATAPAVTARLKTQSKDAFVSDLLGHPMEGGFDLVALSDLEGVGLSTYLIEGWEVPAEHLAGTRTKLDALEGYALILFTSAFYPRDVTLTIDPDLTLIGSYAEETADMTRTRLQSDAAEAYTGHVTPQKTDLLAPKAKGGSLVVAVLVIVVALILWWALS